MPSRKNTLDVSPNDVCLYTSDGLFIGRGSSFLRTSPPSPKGTPHTAPTWTSGAESTKRHDVEGNTAEEAVARRHPTLHPSSSSLSLHELSSSTLHTSTVPPSLSLPLVNAMTDVTDEPLRESDHPHASSPPHSGKEAHSTLKGAETLDNISTTDGAQLVCLYRLFVSLYLSSMSSGAASSTSGLSSAAHVGVAGRSSQWGGFLSARVHLEKYGRLAREEVEDGEEEKEEEEEEEERGGNGKWSSYYSRVEEEEEEEKDRSAVREEKQRKSGKKKHGKKTKKNAADQSRKPSHETKKIRNEKEMSQKKYGNSRLPSPHPSFLSSLYLLPSQPPVTPLLSSAASAAAATLPHVFFPEYLEPSGVLEQHVADHLLHDPTPSFFASPTTSKTAWASQTSEVAPPLPTFASSSITAAPARVSPSDWLKMNTNRSANGLDELPLRLGLGLPFQYEAAETGGAEAAGSLLPSSSSFSSTVEDGEDGDDEEIRRERKRNASGSAKRSHCSKQVEGCTQVCDVATLTVETSARRFTCTLRSLFESTIPSHSCTSSSSHRRRPLESSFSGSSSKPHVASPERQISADEVWEEEARPDEEKEKEEVDEEGGDEKIERMDLRFGEPLVFCCTGKPIG